MKTIWIKTASSLTLVSFIVIAYLANSGDINQFDNIIASFVQSYNSPFMDSLADFLALIGSPDFELTMALIIFLLGGVYLYYKKPAVLRDRVFKLSLIASVSLITYASNPLLKQLFQRPRPEAEYLKKVKKFAFPSDHAMMAFAFYITFAFVFSGYIKSRAKYYLFLVINITLPLLIGFSRVYLNKHYPSDVIAGFILSGFILSISIILTERLAKSQDNE